MNQLLSSPLSMLKPHYDVVVVGSGYGASVAAARLAGTSRNVCVLERGREIPIGEFPARLSDMRRETQVSSSLGHVGNLTGLFDIRLGHDVHVAMGCGLGGTSLINANVCLEPDPRVFEDARWPRAVRADGMLAEGLARARAMLRPVPYPGLRKLLKLQQLAASATALGGQLSLPPLHIAFQHGVNAAGVEQHACTLCGDCCSGCNVGAKTTTALTYLPAAARYGAQIFTRVLVRSVARQSEGKWRINIVTRPEEGWETRLTLTADVVVLGAGTLGSTEILLRSRVEGLAISDCLGERFTTNGDALATAYNNDRPVNSIGVGYPAKVHTEPVGPAVAGLIDLRQTEKLDDGLALVEASLPSGASAILPLLFAAGAPLIGQDTVFSLSDQLDEAGRAAMSLIAGAYQGAVRNTQNFLAVGHDAGRGRLRLERDRVIVDWPDAAQDPVFKRSEDAFIRATAATGGTYMKNPLSLRLMGGNPFTVHPLGGCPMGADSRAGVVNDKGQVFDAATRAASAVHEGLYVCDGAVLPRSIGVHPLLTITALAERAMIHLAGDRKWKMAL